LISLGASINKSNWLGENLLSLAFIRGRDRVASYFLSLGLLSLNPHERLGIKCILIKTGFNNIDILQDYSSQQNISSNKKCIIFHSPLSILQVNVFHFAFMLKPRTILQALHWSPLIKKVKNDSEIEPSLQLNEISSGHQISSEYIKVIDFVGPSNSLLQKDCFGRTPLLVLCMWDGLKCVGGQSKVCYYDYVHLFIFCCYFLDLYKKS
jgi:hypothetical protein